MDNMGNRGRKPGENPQRRSSLDDTELQGRKSEKNSQRSSSFDPYRTHSRDSQGSKSPDLSKYPLRDASLDTSPKADQENFPREIEALLAEFNKTKDGQLREFEVEQEQLSQQTLDIGKDRDRVRVQWALERVKLHKLEEEHKKQRKMEFTADSAYIDAKMEYNSFADKIAQEQARQTELQTQKANAEQKSDDLKDDLKDLKIELGEMENELKGLQQQKNDLDEKLKSEENKLQQQKNDLDENLDTERRKLEDLDTERRKLEDLQQKMRDLEENRQKRITKSNDLNKDKESLEKKIDELEDLPRKKEKLDTELSEERKELTDLNNKRKYDKYDIDNLQISDERLMQIKDEKEHNSLLYKMEIIIAFRGEAVEMMIGLRDILGKERENTLSEVDNSRAYLQRAQEYINIYDLGPEFNHIVKKRRVNCQILQKRR